MYLDTSAVTARRRCPLSRPASSVASPRYAVAQGDVHHTSPELAVSMEQVKANFERYGLDEQVVFLPGWFKDTSPAAPLTALAVARLVGDQSGSTVGAITARYPKLSSGGFLIVDD
jgi:hypothetical protein